MKKKIFSKTIYLLLLLLVPVLFFQVLAAPPTSKYLPGETLDPNCSPGDPNCDVGLTAGSILFANSSSLFSQDNTNLYWDDSNNYLGIGTNSPSSTLDVSGSANISGDLTIDTNTFYLDSSTHRIGIGTSTPSYKLTVSGDLYVSATSTLGSATSTPTILVGYIQSDIIPYSDLTYNLGSSSLRWANLYAGTTTIGSTITIGSHTFEGSATTTLFTTGNSNQLVLGANGNVGIGTAEPGTPLEVTGGIRGGYFQFYNDLDTYMDLAAEDTIDFTVGDFDRLRLDTKGVSVRRDGLRVGSSYWTTAPPNNGLIVEGDVGIGTTSPTEKLTITLDDSSTSTVSTLLGLNKTTTGTAGAGIGAGLMFRAEADDGSLVDLAKITSSFDNASSTSPNTSLHFYTRGGGSLTEAVIIDESGYVGIGTATPRTKLELNNDGAILAIGTYGSGWTEPSLGAGTRLLWYPRKAAFRAGYVGGTEWNDANIGNYSVAMGYRNIASGDESTVAGGNQNEASGIRSTVGGGFNNEATAGGATVSGGSSNTASGSNATVGGGGGNTASGDYATVSGGQSNTAAGDYSWAGGRYMQLSSSADRTFVWGYSDSAFSIDTANAFLIDPSSYGINVGIGTTTPAYTLDVAGTIRATKSLTAGINVETLSGDKTLIPGTDEMYQYLDPGTGSRTITLDTSNASAGDRFVIRNNGAYNTSCYLKISDGTYTLDYIYAGAIKKFIFDGTNWISAGIGTGENDIKRDSVTIGFDARGYKSGTAVGRSTLGYDYGAAVG